MRRLMFTSLICVLGVMAMSVRANAAPVRIHVEHNAILSATYLPNQAHKNEIGLRLRRGITGHGHLNAFRTLRLTAYNEDGTIIANTHTRIGKRQTYAHMDIPAAFEKAPQITITLQ